MNFLFLAAVLTYDAQSLLASKQTPLLVAGFLTNVAFALVLFYWIDSSILVARRTDPLLRDTFAWRRLRFVFWALLLALLALSFAPINSVFQGIFSSNGTLFGYFLFFVVVISGSIILPIAAFRSKDTTLRRHLMWFGYFVGGVFFSSLPFLVQPGTIVPDPLPVSLTYLVAMFSAYCIYRSVRSLAPLNRLSLVEAP